MRAGLLPTARLAVAAPVATAVVAVAVAVAGCAMIADPSPTRLPAPERVELTVFAAASLRRVLEVADTTYEAANPGTTITLATDSSAALRTQIEQGAPADLFLAADTTNPQTLVDAGLADGDAVAFAGNELAVIVPSDDPGGITTPADLARDDVRVIAAGAEVPITRYASQLIVNLATLDGYPVDFAAAYDANVVSREDNVAAVVAKIELGEGDAAIVYATDAATSDAVAVVGIPPAANVRATYAGVVIRASTEPDAARAFLDWLVGADGQAILGAAGFLPPPS